MKTNDLSHLCRLAQIDVAFALFLGLLLHLMLRAWIG